jgi:UDP-N-acetylmuramate-alanine ligase
MSIRPCPLFWPRKNRGHAGYAESNLAGKPDLVVIGNAISRGNPEAEAVLDQKLRYCSLPELLKEFFIRGKRSLVVAGTHGKTTTTSLLAWVFRAQRVESEFSHWRHAQ